ncbi:DUF1190 domain-containing protein [Rhodanobacter sp. DHG33]|uniref:DUF1190 domain-containing protein n=1 Tax=Rhodanobacter sp. DHG33 TaxID=2775921 RepID=UPI0017821A99|nr:DUF1190 domain-containing protein [Rhodanobacter sp. DHG33]
MKRSTTASLVLMGLAPLLLTACDDPPAPTQQSFATVDNCVAAGVPRDTCQTAHDQAIANAEKDSPHFGTLEQCIAQFGAGMCQQSGGDHGSFWMPMLGGFMIARLFDSSNNTSYVPVGPIYRSASGGYYSPPSNGVYGGSYRSSASGWGSTASGDGSSGSGSRAITASRGGFGSAHAAAGGWGG